ncbi:MAG: TusE/DsrC/DsvC family sulfur relay protein [Anaerolineae bacterium]|nr:MAG: TusE/DsrC/DsvC family sulfur relay protein [Anaerolineae bacterium]
MTALLESVAFNEEGFLLNPNDWTPELAQEIAAQEGIELTDKHWEIINFCREKGLETGAAPTLRQITKGTGISTKELFALFPKGPAKKVAKIAGLGKPEGCV